MPPRTLTCQNKKCRKKLRVDIDDHHAFSCPACNILHAHCLRCDHVWRAYKGELPKKCTNRGGCGTVYYQTKVGTLPRGRRPNELIVTVVNG